MSSRFLSHGLIRYKNDRFYNCHAEAFLRPLPLVILYGGYSRWKEGDRFHRSRSDIFSIEYVVGGSMSLSVDSRVYEVGPGEVFLLNKGETHTFQTGRAGYVNKRMVVLDGVMLDIVLKTLNLEGRTVVSPRDPARFVSLIKQSYRCLCEQHRENLWQLSLIAYEILLELGKSVAERTLPREVSRALDYMNTHVQHNLTLADIAQKSGLSMYHFSRLFSRAMHCSPITFFNRQKMALAKNLLVNTGMQIQEIAMILGYEDPFYFSTQFRKATGHSPRRFRKEHAVEYCPPKPSHPETDPEK